MTAKNNPYSPLISEGSSGSSVYDIDSINVSGRATVESLRVTDSTSSTSSTTGAAVVTGGVGVVENLYVGGVAGVTGTLSVIGAATFTAGLTSNDDITLGAGDDLVGSSTSKILMNTDKFTVDGSNGNTVVAGTLGVTGALTATGGIIMANGATIGQAAGPLVAFDDTNNYLEITGCNVGVNTITPTSAMDILARDDTSQNILALRLSDNTAKFQFFLDGSSNSEFYIGNSSEVIIRESGISYFNGGNVVIGHTASLDGGYSSTDPKLTIANSAAATILSVQTFSTGPHLSVLSLGKSGSATIGTLAATSDTNILGAISFDSVNSSSARVTGAYIQATQVGAAGETYNGTKIQFFTGTNTAAASEKLTITDVGNTQPGADDTYDLGASSFRWDDIYATNSTIQTSDEYLKKDILDSSLGLDFINKLRAVEYRYKDSVITINKKDGETEEIQKTYHRKHFGLTAQQVKKTLDDMSISSEDFAGYVSKDGFYGLRYQEFIGPMIKAIQQLTTRIEALEKI